MNGPPDPDDALRARVRAALAAADSATPPPPFARLWSRAAAPPARPRVAAWAGAGALGLCAVAAVALWLAARPGSAPPSLAARTAHAADPDYRLARELAERFAARSPADALAERMPGTLARGLPALDDVPSLQVPEEMTL